MDLPETIAAIPGSPSAIRWRASQYARTADAILDACEKGDLDDYYAAVELHYTPLRDLLDQPDPART